MSEHSESVEDVQIEDTEHQRKMLIKMLKKRIWSGKHVDLVTECDIDKELEKKTSDELADILTKNELKDQFNQWKSNGEEQLKTIGSMIDYLLDVDWVADMLIKDKDFVILFAKNSPMLDYFINDYIKLVMKLWGLIVDHFKEKK